MEKPALLIIDMQNDFVLEGKPLKVAGAQAVIPKIQSVLAEFRKRSLPVFHVLRVHRPDGSDVEIIRQDLFRKQPFAVAGTPGAAVIDELAPLKGEYVLEKTRMSAFIGTELDLMLRTLGVSTLFVCGIQTPNCIRTTVFDGIACNYPVVLIDDATGASSGEVHRANVRDMQNIGVRIVKTAEIPGILG
jgi:nicotinamidase-related amidase